MSKIKAKIIYYLSINNLSLTDLAKEAEVSISYVHQVISGKRSCSKKLENVLRSKIPQNILKQLVKKDKRLKNG